MVHDVNLVIYADEVVLEFTPNGVQYKGVIVKDSKFIGKFGSDDIKAFVKMLEIIKPRYVLISPYCESLEIANNIAEQYNRERA